MAVAWTVDVAKIVVETVVVVAKNVAQHAVVAGVVAVVVVVVSVAASLSRLNRHPKTKRPCVAVPWCTHHHSN